MKQVLTAIALVATLAFATTVIASTTWDYSSSYSARYTEGVNTADNGGFVNGFILNAERPPYVVGEFNAYDSTSLNTDQLVWSMSANPDALGGSFYCPTTQTQPWGTNTGSSLANLYMEAGKVFLFEGVQNSDTAVRWTAPATGQYQVNAVFNDINMDANAATQTAVVYVRKNGSQVWNTTLDGFSGTAAAGYADHTGTTWAANYSSLVTLAAGDTLDFVMNGGIGQDQNTDRTCVNFDATITATPEPASMVILATGLIGLLAYAWRKRK